MHADDAYKEAQMAVQQLKQGLAEDSSIKVYVDIQAEVSHRMVFEDGKVKEVMVHSRTDQISLIKDGLAWAFTGALGNTMCIISGHGTGILTPVYTEHGWLYEKDDGPAPCKAYAASRYENFCEQVTALMEGKSLLTAKKTTFLSTEDLNEVLGYAVAVLGKKLDIMGFDSCYMAQLEIAYEVAPYARYMVASQESEEKEGWNYFEVIRSLRHSEVLEAVRKLVYRYERMQRHKGADRFSLSAVDLSLVTECALTLDYLVAACRSVDIEALCEVRTRLHKVSGIPMYADVTEFIEELLIELDCGVVTPSVEQVKASGLRLLELLHLMLPARVAGPSCTFLRGCSVYFPLAHIDSSYRGAFVREHAWYDFLKFFTSSEDMMMPKVEAFS
jgi:hypothetical protein